MKSPKMLFVNSKVVFAEDFAKVVQPILYILYTIPQVKRLYLELRVQL